MTAKCSSMNQLYGSIKQLEERIKHLEDYCLNVDYHSVPVPKELEYLFKIDKNQHQTLDNGTYVRYMIRGKRSGVGKYTFLPSGDTYEGRWVNQRRHGQGNYTRIESGEVEEQRYVLDIVDGLKVDSLWIDGYICISRSDRKSYQPVQRYMVLK